MSDSEFAAFLTDYRRNTDRVANTKRAHDQAVGDLRACVTYAGERELEQHGLKRGAEANHPTAKRVRIGTHANAFRFDGVFLVDCWRMKPDGKPYRRRALVALRINELSPRE